MYWIILIIAGLFEVAFAGCLGKAQMSEGSTAIFWYAMFIVCLACSMLLLMKATQHIPIGTAYGVWTGIGAVGSALIGIFFFKEPVTFWRIFFVCTLIASVVGLKMVSVPKDVTPTAEQDQL